MGLFDKFSKKEKDGQGSGHEHQEQDYQPPPGPPPSYSQTKGGPSSWANQDSEFAPPPGPPPSHLNSHSAGYAYQSQAGQSAFPNSSFEDVPPPGPPPPHLKSQTAISSGASASYGGAKTQGDEQYAPPAGPPPSYHNWQVIPDTSLLPPPPSFSNTWSKTSNATEQDAENAYQWCESNRPFPPGYPDHNTQNAVLNGVLTLRQPAHFDGRIVERPSRSGNGPPGWDIYSTPRNQDFCFLSSLPLYFTEVNSPFNTEIPKTIYYEITIRQLRGEASAAIGYTVAPYPSWRQPGWERGSLAVHADDGNRYMNHNGGGYGFTSKVEIGETIGLGITFSIPDTRVNVGPQGQPAKGEVFLIRDHQRGEPVRKAWNIQDDLDADEGWRADFLDGKYDIYAAIGLYQEAQVSVAFAKADWKYDPQARYKEDR